MFEKASSVLRFAGVVLLSTVLLAMFLEPAIAQIPGDGNEVTSTPEDNRRLFVEEFFLQSGYELVAVSALLISEPDNTATVQATDGSIAMVPRLEQRAADLSRVSDGQWLVVVSLKEEDYHARNKLTVVGATASGEAVASAVRQLKPDVVVAGDDLVSCKKETMSVDIEELLALDRERLIAVVELRKNRRDLLRGLVSTTLKQSLVERLNATERSFGINPQEPITAQTNASELAKRLVAIEALSKGQEQK